MFFALTDEQRALQSSLRQYAADRFPLSAVRAVFDDPAGDGDPVELRRAVADQGWLAGLIPERFDGLGLGVLDACVIARCWGEALLPGSMPATTIAAEAIRLAGSEEQQARWLPRVAAGELRLSLATDTKVQVDGNALSGRATQVEYGHVADRLVVMASDCTQASLWLVDPAADGVTITRQDSLDRTTRICGVTFADVPAEPLGSASATAAAEILDRGAVLYANDLVGLARQALTRTVEYDGIREQFGRPVGSFQALKHALANLHVAVTMAEHAAWYAAHALDEGLPSAPMAVSVAKAKANLVARDATATMIQFHGGIGYTWEHDAHFYFKRAKREEYLFGDTPTHLERVARSVIGVYSVSHPPA